MYSSLALTIMLGYPLLLSIAITIGDKCPAYTEGKECTNVTTYKDFRTLIQIEKAEGELVLCPFDIDMAEDDVVTWIKRDLHLICQRKNACIIRGGAYQIKVHGTNQVVFQGFTLMGASKSAFRVWKKSPKLQKLCNIHFIGNKGFKKGSALRLEGREIFVGHCNFTDNESVQQGAGLYTYGNAVVFNSTFFNNTAHRGSGIFVDSLGSLMLQESHFEGNLALGKSGPVIYINDGGRFYDNGNNTVNDNVGKKECEGAWTESGCQSIYFFRGEEDGDTAETSVDDIRTENVAAVTNITGEDRYEGGKHNELPTLRIRGYNERKGNLKKCEGDCNRNDDCEGYLNCYTRHSYGGKFNSVPGCDPKSKPKKRTDYCYDPIDAIGLVTDKTGIAVDLNTVENISEYIESTLVKFESFETAILKPPSAIASLPAVSTLPPFPTKSPSSSSSVATASSSVENISRANIFTSDPKDPPAGYFNYNPKSMYGPGKWHKVNANKTSEYRFWRKFRSEIKENLERNFCASDKRQQSPIDVVDTGAICFEYHQIRDRPGDFLVEDLEVEKEIGANKLRVIWPRRNGDEPDPPGADFPKGWGNILDATNSDIVIPAAHTINGQDFVGEYRIYHMHEGGKGSPVIASLMAIDSLNRTNSHLQELLNEFQKMFDKDAIECRKKNRRKRGLRPLQGQSQEFDASDVSRQNVPQVPEDERFSAKKLQEQNARFDHRDRSDPLTSFGRWDPYDKSVVPSLWFYGYEGGLTEPPCTPFLSWRIMDKPIYISTPQLQQMRNLIFDHVDGECNPTSNHFFGNAARPIQTMKLGSEVHHCTCKDYTSDEIRSERGIYSCSNDPLSIFHNDHSSKTPHLGPSH